VKRLYMMSYDMGLKGVTYFRDGSRLGVLQREEKKEEKKEIELPKIPVTPRIQRPMMLTGVTYKAESPSGKVYVTINEDGKGDAFEVFINHGKSGSDLMALADALGRMISFVLRIHSPVPSRERVREIVSELTGIGGSKSIGFGPNRVRSLPDAIAKVLANHNGFRVNGKVEDMPKNGLSNGNGHGLAEEHPEAEITLEEKSVLKELPFPDVEPVVAAAAASISSSHSTSLFDLCPECGTGSFAYEEGCKKCHSCGYSEC